MIIRSKSLILHMDLLEFFKRDPIRFAFEIYDLNNEREYTKFLLHEDGYLMFFRKFDIPSIILYAEKEETARYLISKIPDKKFLLFTDTLWEKLIKEIIPLSHTYKEKLMICNNPRIFHSEYVRRLSIKDKDHILNFYKERGVFVVRMLNEGKTTVYGAFIDGKLVSAAYTLIENKDVAVIGGVITAEEFRNRGLAKSIVSALTSDIVNRGMIASLLVRHDNLPAVNVYKAIGFIEYGERLWIDVNTGLKP